MDKVQRRMAECPCRRPATCGVIDIALGWQHPISMQECDGCLAAGGQSGPKPQEYVQLVLRNVTAGIDRVRNRVIDIMIVKHMEPVAAAQALLKHAPRLGRQRATSIAERIQAPAAIRAELDSRFGAMTPEEELDALAPEERWAAVARTWAEVEEETKDVVEDWSWAKRVAFFVWAKAFGKGVAQGELETRSISCFGTDLTGRRVKDHCPSLRFHEGKPYCGDCKCGFRARAMLLGKIQHKKLACPRRMPGFSNARLTVHGQDLSKNG